ncbi:MAG TPA: VOC family protein, partial [Candidatus Dormibacteraeota bacterium]|nr:VOC family protein [Candidatus Dormibacteraeota bacterium]
PVAGAPPAPIRRVWHVGVAVHDLEARMKACRALLGVTDWSVVELRPEAATLDGRPVENAFLVARAPLAGFELELIQPTVEPTHYRRELLDRYGEGIHHVLALPRLTDAELAETRAWMAARGVPVAMSGGVRGGAAEFFYFDTRALLGGYLLEAIVRRDGRV